MQSATLSCGEPLALWYDLVRDGASRAGTALPEAVESYLVFVLQRHQRDVALGGRTLALERLDAEDRIGQLRADALRDVGDRCLLIAGLFPRLAERRRVGPDYYAAMGRSAYAGVATATRAGYAELFAQLAQAFNAMRQVLLGVGPQVESGIPSKASPAHAEAWARIRGLNS
jgi:hypothetical protein